MVVIGLTGTIGAGKGTIADFFKKELGFEHFSVRDLLWDEVDNRGLERSRESLVSVGNDLRKENGPSFLVDKLYEKASSFEKSIIESFRCPGEVEALRGHNDFFLLAVDADRRTRYNRVRSRGSETDGVSFEDFCQKEDLEMNSRDPFKQNISTCMRESDYFILNDGRKNNLLDRLQESFAGIDRGGRLNRRPTYDEMFMHEAHSWGKRSTCLRRNVGAVLARDGVFISQGYNGSPRGFGNCIDLNVCYRQENNVPSGQRLEKCRAVHAEPNAIINAAKNGKSPEGTTIYVTTFPCNICAGLIINSGIKEVVFDSDYANPESKDVFGACGVGVRKYEGVSPKAFYRFFK